MRWVISARHFRAGPSATTKMFLVVYKHGEILDVCDGLSEYPVLGLSVGPTQFTKSEDAVALVLRFGGEGAEFKDMTIEEVPCG